MDLPPELQKAAPGVAGSLTALLLMIIRGEKFKHAFLLGIAGAFLAHFLGPSAADVMHSSPATAGYVTGLFGIAIITKAFDMIRSFDHKKAGREVWLAILKRVRG
jgi:uncharacterized membrane protein YeaQ/YmgE (transglycosylase-associated protein family)